MEAFNLLKYWKGPASRTQNDVQTDPDDDGPFFDLELALTDDDNDSEDDANHNQNENENVHNNNDSDSDSESESEKELKLRVCPSISSDDDDRSLSLSSSDDLIIKGNIILTNPSDSKPQFTASLFKSATKFRVFKLGLKKPKPKPNSPTNNTTVTTTSPKPKQRKLFTLKFKVEEVPIVSLFTSRDNTSKSKPSQDDSQPHSPSSDDKRFMRNYFKMVKPLYVRVSRRYADKIVTSPESGKASTPAEVDDDDDSESEASVNNVKIVHKHGNVVPLPAALRKHLGKPRSAPPLPSSNRRDDSLLQQHDWIQGAILHCKNSFNASTECESSQLPQSVSDQLCDITP